MPKLVGGWIGEFGHELFCFQGHLRYLSKDFDKTIIISRPQMKPLYDDFISEFVPFDPKSEETNGWDCKIKNKKRIDQIVSVDKDDMVVPFDFNIGFYHINPERTKEKFYQQKFIKYGTPTDEKFDLLIHARSTQKFQTGDRNWHPNKWTNLVKGLKGLKIASIGSNVSSSYVGGTTNLRGVPLERLFNIMSGAKLFVGPSSGPAHLASLCGLPHIVWSPEENRMRYEKLWNPFNTPVQLYSEEGWNPSVAAIKELILANLSTSHERKI